MIAKITINGVASYKKESSLTTDSKINLIYGLNGSGKTIISNYLSNLGHDEFVNCSIDNFNSEGQKILVYNQKFVEENFYEVDFQKGIFTLAKENKEALKNIQLADIQKSDLQDKIDGENGLKKQLTDKDHEIQSNLIHAQNEIWKIKTKYAGGDRVFDNARFLDGYKGSKEALFEHIKGLKLLDTSKTIEEIKKELEELSGDATKREQLTLIDGLSLLEIEEDNIFQESIIGHENSSVATLISRLGNSDWVKKGIDYFPKDDGKTCPLCQENTLTTNLQNEIKNYFDENYETKVNNLQKLKNCYKLELQENENKDFFNNTDQEKIKRLIGNLKNLVSSNTKEIGKKIEKPSQVVTLKSTQLKIEEINRFIEEKNKEIDSFNQKISNRNKEIEQLKDEFWKILRKEYHPIILNFKNRNEKLKGEKKSINDKIKSIDEGINKQKQIILDNQKQCANVEQTIDEINKHLLDFGIQDFKIAKHEDNYRIKREYEENENEFRYLSEGEKTVISFLYFVELCKGEKSLGDIKEKIIVIDDPISSLSHMYMFNVAQLIKQYFTDTKQNSFTQCFILTHSLYFFHELVNRSYAESDDEEKSKLQKFFRIEKKETSSINEMRHSEIKNEYEIYWDVVKNASQENMPLVANAMRNIIEYFFGFIDKADSINNIFQKKEFKDNNFQSFKRYIDRESHSDRSNINDYKEFNLETFKDAFKQVFVCSFHEKHYNKYIQ